MEEYDRRYGNPAEPVECRYMLKMRVTPGRHGYQVWPSADGMGE